MDQVSLEEATRRHIQEIIESLTCPICQEEYRALKLFPQCQHFVCLECETGLIANGNGGRNGRVCIKCPTCRSEATVPAGGFPPYRQANEMIGNAKRLQERLNITQISNGSNRQRQSSRHIVQPSALRGNDSLHHQQQNNDRSIPDNVSEDELRLQQVLLEQWRQRDMEVEPENQQQHGDNERQPLVAQRGRSESLTQLVKDDNRCECECHESCLMCLDMFGDSLKEEFACHCDGFWGGIQRCFTLCWRVFCIMKTAKPCIAVFSPRGHMTHQENPEYAYLRTSAWKLFRGQQKPILTYWLRVAWSLLLTIVFLTCLITNVSTPTTEHAAILDIAILMNLIGFIIWLCLCIVNLTRYRPSGPSQVRNLHCSFTHFTMEQFQQILSELSLYLQIIISCVDIKKYYHTSGALPFYLCAGTWLLLICFRLYTFCNLWRFLRTLRVRFALSQVGCIIIIPLWFSALIMFPWSEPKDDQTMIRADVVSYSLVCLLAVFNYAWNIVNFFISHLYEVTLQCGLIARELERLGNAQETELIRATMQRMMNMEPFHKNMYAMMYPFQGFIIYVWFLVHFGIAIVVIKCLPMDSSTIPFWALFSVAFVVNLLVNSKTMLLACSSNITVLVVLLLFAMCFFVAQFILLLFIAIFLILIGMMPCFLLYAMCECCCDCCCSR